ncbi:MAG: F0F1 ATP synthase subunit A [Aphanocapsa lilacina HA4352-LM1]|jgi:F-type H+-transporting ATPase subunit a|nr:F0F1 ATP synthase subunit A [Aphanocapsa lilacina HA4352-LM1]
MEFALTTLGNQPLIAAVEVGKHLTWQLGPLSVHGQTMITTWVVMLLLIGLTFIGTRKLQRVPSGLQNFLEYAYDLLASIARNQIGEKQYRAWVPLIGTIFLFVLFANWLGQLPLRLFHIPEGELASPTNDINTTVALSLIALVSYIYAGLRKSGLGYFKHYFESPILAAVWVLEFFTRPLSLSIRLFGNILAEELVVAVLILLVPILVPVPLMILFLLTGAIQALVFSTLTASYVGEAVEDHDDHH